LEGLNVRLAISEGETATLSGQMSMQLHRRWRRALQAQTLHRRTVRVLSISRGYLDGDTRFGIQDFALAFRIIFFAMPSATICSERGMRRLLLQPGREEEGFRTPGSHRVTG
jgi:hypothetical protein